MQIQHREAARERPKKRQPRIASIAASERAIPAILYPRPAAPADYRGALLRPANIDANEQGVGASPFKEVPEVGVGPTRPVGHRIWNAARRPLGHSGA